MNFIIILLRQLIFIGPILWLLELFQNRLYFMATGKWGWVYPDSPWHWFSFQTLPNWTASVAVMFLLYRFWLYPKKINVVLRITIVGLAGFLLEYLNGFAFFSFTGKYLFVWEQSSLVFIDWIALPMWFFNAAVYHFLSCTLINMHE